MSFDEQMIHSGHPVYNEQIWLKDTSNHDVNITSSISKMASAGNWMCHDVKHKIFKGTEICISKKKRLSLGIGKSDESFL